MDPVRTCLGCRQRVDTPSLLRVVVRNGDVVADPSAILTGRGAWLHPTIECVDTAIKRKAFGRAFRVSVALNAQQLRQAITEHKASPVGASSGAL